MKELSLNVLDIAKNSVKAGASLIGISLVEQDHLLTLTITDNGCGMTQEVLQGVVNPFYTTRTTRKVGLGIPLLSLAAEQTGGTVSITSRHESTHPNNHGTEVVATFYTNHIDFTPIGDLISSIETLIMGSPDIDFVFTHRSNELDVGLDTREMRQILGDDVSLASYEIIQWIREYLQQQYDGSQ